ncbi:MAG: hypothetical protein WCR06_12145 [bacterium]
MITFAAFHMDIRPADLAGIHQAFGPITFKAEPRRSADGYDLLLLPCAHYNFSTPGERMPGPYPGIPVLHFKGKRKDDMLPYWRQHLAHDR